MLGATLAAALLALGPPTTPDPSALVARLGSPRFAQREAAEAELARLGRLALPALRSARGSKDPEIQVRARLLARRIESALLVEPTLVAFDFQGVPIGEAIQAINRQSGLDLELDPSAPEHRLTLRTDGPLPFWKAVDALSEAARLRHEPGEPPLPGRREGTFLLRTGPAMTAIPTSDHGPFRVQVVGVHASADQRTRPFFLQVLVEAEPRLSVTQNGAVRVEEAVDSRGRSLRIAGRPGLARPEGEFYGMNPGTSARLRVDLARPEPPGGRIAVLKGTIPLIVAARKSDPIDIPIASEPGRTVAGEDATLVLHGTRPSRAGRPTAIELSIRPNGGDDSPIDSGDGEPLAYRPDSTRQQIEVLDARGNVLPWFPAGISYNEGEIRLTMTLPATEPTTIRYYGITRATVDVPFEFRDLPIP